MLEKDLALPRLLACIVENMFSWALADLADHAEKCPLKFSLAAL